MLQNKDKSLPEMSVLVSRLAIFPFAFGMKLAYKCEIISKESQSFKNKHIMHKICSQAILSALFFHG